MGKFLALLKVIRFIPIIFEHPGPIDLEIARSLLDSLVQFSKLLDSGVKVHRLHGRYLRLEIPWINALSPPLPVKDAIELSYFLLRLKALLERGATLNLEKQIISLDFYPHSPKFKVELWSDMYESLYIYYAERLFGKLLARNNITLRDM